jgi:hypothetical protein
LPIPKTVCSLPPFRRPHCLAAELEQVNARLAELRAETAALETKAAELEAKMPKRPPAVPVPKTTCVICLCDFDDDDEAQQEGLMCAAEIGFGHFVCCECLQVELEAVSERDAPTTFYVDPLWATSRADV